MEATANKERLQKYLKRKEVEAQHAKEKGMKCTYGNLLLEISLVKKQLRKYSMGSK